MSETTPPRAGTVSATTDVVGPDAAGKRDRPADEMLAMLGAFTLPHFCQDDHDPVAWAGNDERCPVCRLRDERDEAERMGHDAVEWIGVVRDELAAAGFPPGDRTVALANLRALIAARESPAP